MWRGPHRSQAPLSWEHEVDAPAGQLVYAPAGDARRRAQTSGDSTASARPARRSGLPVPVPGSRPGPGYAWTRPRRIAAAAASLRVLACSFASRADT
jgi:hypothetical protein